MFFRSSLIVEKLSDDSDEKPNNLRGIGGNEAVESVVADFMIVYSQIHFFSRTSKISTVMRCTPTKCNS